MTPVVVLGVDPGLEGGWALIEAEPCRKRAKVLERGDVLRDGRRIDLQQQARVWRQAMTRLTWRDDPPEILASIERVDASPQAGRSSSFAFGWAAGALEGLLAGLGVREVVSTTPSVWKARLGLPGGRKGKAASVALATRLTGVAEGWSEHEAEATLIAWVAALDRVSGAHGVVRDGEDVLT